MDFRKEIVKLVSKSIKIKVDDSLLEIPPDPNFGDYALPCFSFSKKLKKSPNQIAEEIVRKLIIKEPVIRADVKGPYVNFFISKSMLAEQVLNQIVKDKEDYGKIKIPPAKKKRVMVEFPSPNTNKPLHLGHIRNMLIGESVSRLLEATGNKVTRANVNNDRGIHICKSMLAYQKWGRDMQPDKKTDHFVGDWYVKFNSAAETNQDLEKEAQEMLQKWEKKDKEVRQLWKLMNAWAYGGFEDTYEALGLSFDTYYYESEYYDKGKEIVMKALKKKIFKKDKDGAILAPLENKYKLPDKFMLRADGTSIYMTQDVFLAEKKVKDYKLDQSIYVVGSEQNMHFK